MDYSSISDLSVEPSTTRHLTDAQKQRMTLLLDQYLTALENGAPPSLESLAENDPELIEPLRSYVSGLEDLHQIAAGFVPQHCESDAETDSESEKVLGDFRLLEEVGRGGMGVVYRARQLSLDRSVAIKLLPFASVLDARQIVRFKNEAQAAAQLHHPNIVPVYTVGSARGVHYYAMQYIEGQSFDQIIAQQRASGTQPDVAETVRAGIHIANALHAAHQFGVIHRDIKPSNLMRDRDGKVWVTDFGLARCQTEATMTKTGDVVGTVRYMSPEQARGETAIVDGRTDIYSLGATLYEMLCLKPAQDAGDAPSILRQIDERRPASLRAVRPEIPKDLETVIEKAMSKHRDGRYDTASDFAADLGRVLEGRPTIAKPPTALDRISHWSHRHRSAVAASILVLVVAVIGFATSTALIASAKRESDINASLAKRSDRLARDTVDRLGAQTAQLLAEIPAADPVRRQLLRETLAYYERFAQHAAVDPKLDKDLAITYGKIGSLQNEIGTSEQAITSLRKSKELLERLVDRSPENLPDKHDLATSINNLALALERSGKYSESEQEYLDAISLGNTLITESPAQDQYRAGLALAYSNYGLLLSKIGRLEQSRSAYEQSISIAESVASEHRTDELQQQLASTFQNLSGMLAEVAPDEAISYARSALELQLQKLSGEADNPNTASRVALTLNSLGTAQSARGDLESAVESFRQAADIQQQLIDRWPGVQSYQRDMAVTQNNYGLSLSSLNRFEASREAFDKALVFQVALVGEFESDADLQSTLGGIYNNHAFVLEKLNLPDQALKSYQLAVNHQRVAHDSAPEVPRYREFLSKHYYNCGRLLRETGRPDQAVAFAVQRRGLWEQDGDRLASVAEEFMATATQMRLADSGTVRSSVTASECIEYATETMRQAIMAGFEPGGDFFHRPEYRSLHPLLDLDRS